MRDDGSNTKSRGQGNGGSRGMLSLQDSVLEDSEGKKESTMSKKLEKQQFSTKTQGVGAAGRYIGADFLKLFKSIGRFCVVNGMELE